VRAFDVLRPEAPEEYERNPKSDPDWEWAKEPQVRAAVRPRIAEQARVATFLANEGLALNARAHELFVDAVSDNLLPALTLLERRANGDYPRASEEPWASAGLLGQTEAVVQMDGRARDHTQQPHPHWKDQN
jgi:hypothetical protein